jgi:hypothetical protein
VECGQSGRENCGMRRILERKSVGLQYEQKTFVQARQPFYEAGEVCCRNQQALQRKIVQNTNEMLVGGEWKEREG